MNLIKKFNDYIDIVEESLDSPVIVSWRIDDDDSLVGYFEIDDIVYKIECFKQFGNNWSYSFSFLDGNNWSFELNNSNKSIFRVLSTIQTNIYYLYEQKNPNSILFSAIDSNDTRKRLYSSVCTKFCKDKNLNLSNRGNDDYIMYLIFKKDLSDIDKGNVFKSVKKVIEQGK